MCECVFIVPDYFSLLPSFYSVSLCSASEASGAICQFFACAHVRLCVCVCLKLLKEWVYYANERKDEEKKQRVAVSRRAEKEGKWNGNDFVCVHCSLYLCVWASAQELHSQPLIWPLPGSVSALWFDTVCVNWKAAGAISSFTGNTLGS